MADLMLSYSQSKDSINIKDIEIICKTDIDGKFPKTFHNSIWSIYLSIACFLAFHLFIFLYFLKIHYAASRWLGFLLTKRTVIHFQLHLSCFPTFYSPWIYLVWTMSTEFLKINLSCDPSVIFVSFLLNFLQLLHFQLLLIFASLLLFHTFPSGISHCFFPLNLI